MKIDLASGLELLNPEEQREIPLVSGSHDSFYNRTVKSHYRTVKLPPLLL